MKRLAVFIAVCMIAVSCGPAPDGPVQPLASAVKMHQDDVPIPVGYAYQGEKSRIEAFASFRLCEMVYESQTDAKHGVNAVKAFYRQLMPGYDWQESAPSKNPAVMIFKKNGREDEYCRITVYREKRTTLIHILIGNEKLIRAE